MQPIWLFRKKLVAKTKIFTLNRERLLQAEFFLGHLLILLGILVSTSISGIIATGLVVEKWVCVWDFNWAKLTDIYILNTSSFCKHIGCYWCWRHFMEQLNIWLPDVLEYMPFETFFTWPLLWKIIFPSSLKITYFHILFKACLRCTMLSLYSNY